MKRIFLLFCIVSFSLIAQTQSTDNTAKELEAARARAAAEEQKLEAKQAKEQAKAEEKARKDAEKQANANSTNITQNSGYSFFGGNAVGFNFAPTSQVSSFNYSLRYLKLLDGLDISSKNGGFGMGFSYEHRLAKWVTLSGDFNFAKWGINAHYNDIKSLVDIPGGFDLNRLDELASKLKVGLNFDTKAWAVGFRFYTGGKAPFGFFLYPRIGGTIFTFSGYYPEYEGKDKLEAILNPDFVTENRFSRKTHGMYVAMELGWRIQLFPKLMAKSPVQIGLDISLLDLGYYFTPWTTGILAETKGLVGSSLDKYEKFMRIRIVPIPRLGITIKF